MTKRFPGLLNTFSLRKGLIISLLLISASCKIYNPAIKHQRIIEFSGFTWIVKEGSEPQGPGPNYFGSGNDQVWVDDKGLLHLKVKYIDNHWCCAEVFSTKKFSNGKITFHLASRIDQLDPNIVVGLFTWHPNPRLNNQEIDIEISRWGDVGNLNAQYVVQPEKTQKDSRKFAMELNGTFSTHEITIGKDFLFFESYHGHGDSAGPGGVISNWLTQSRNGKNFRNAQIRINLWLFKGMPPVNQREAELIIKKVEFVPLSQLQS